MPTDQTRNVSLMAAELNAFIRAQVASGQCQNAGEVARASLLERQQRRNRRKEATLPSGQAGGR